MWHPEEIDGIYYETDTNNGGLWESAGHRGMMRTFHDPNYATEVLEDVQKEDGCINDDNIVDLEEEDSANLAERLRSKNLSIADCALYRIAEGKHPPICRICRISEEHMMEILELKSQGNQAFEDGKYQEAIELYEEALDLFPMDMFVAPTDVMTEVINLISNQAECELKEHDYHAAAMTATDALFYDASHAKSRIRRAKADIALAARHQTGDALDYLILASYDLERVLKDAEENQEPDSPAAITARGLLNDVEHRLRKEKDVFIEKRPHADWDLTIKMQKSKCW